MAKIVVGCWANASIQLDLRATLRRLDGHPPSRRRSKMARGRGRGNGREKVRVCRKGLVGKAMQGEGKGKQEGKSKKRNRQGKEMRT